MLDDDIVSPVIYTDLSFEEKLYYPRWFVRLSNEQEVTSKPGRRSWLELRSYLMENPALHIVGLWFSFRDNVEQIHVGEADYFFTNIASAWYGGPTEYLYCGGYRDGSIVRSRTYKIPEIVYQDEVIRPLDDPSVIKGLIKKK